MTVAKSKKPSTSNKKTLDMHHNAHMEQIGIYKDEILKLRIHIEKLNTKIKLLDKKKSEVEVSDETINEYIKLVDERLDKQEILRELVRKSNDREYLTNTADILFNYYDLLEKGHGNYETETVKSSNEKSILKYFTMKDSENVVVQRPIEESKEKSRGNLLDDYMFFTDENFIKDKVFELEERCAHCNSKQVTIMNNDGYVLCKDCNSIEYIIIDHDKPSYRDPPKEITYWSYKRLNHLNELILSRFEENRNFMIIISW